MENKLIKISAFGMEIGKLGYDLDKKKALFQFHLDFLKSKYSNMFPYIFKKTERLQTFSQFEGNTFKGLPPMIADSLPDAFGNIVFQEWLKSQNKNKITPLEQLTYVANRGMGALEYLPVKELPESTAIDLNQIIKVLHQVLDNKNKTLENNLNDLSLVNIFKIGTSAGGARAKVLISEHKKTGQIKPGDLEISKDYNHYLVKLCLDEADGYNKEKVEYAYYLLTQQIGLTMMPSKLIDNKHFATLRYDRQKGEKQHVLTASGLTGWDFMKPEHSSYEDLFRLAVDLKVPHKDLQELYKRMVFNLVFANIDDHLKNHSFMYHLETNKWTLAPMYDVTYPLNALNNYSKVARALAINNKRADITRKDLLALADTYSIKNPNEIINTVTNIKNKWRTVAEELNLPSAVIQAIENDFVTLKTTK